MNDTVESTSLLSYLEADKTGLRITVSVDAKDDSAHPNRRFPFLVASDSGPLSCLVSARIQTDAGANIEPVFLMTQKDEYAFTADDLWPLNNLVIDQYWQRTLSFYSHKNSHTTPLVLKAQISNNGTLIPFAPIFYCNLKQSYFHPLCPDCSAALQQCCNDTLLKECGLQPYSSSLKRYLFCPACVESKKMPDFYVSSLAGDDPDFLHERFDLIKKFRKLTGQKPFANRLPCDGCNRYPECYGPDSLAVSRISVFSFYPFYMLMFKADSINALDFLPLISGASYKEIQGRLVANRQLGRFNCLKILKRKGIAETPFFFRNDSRYFLEVLYLKLSFLGELARSIFSGLDTFQPPGFGLSLDRIWIKISDQNSLLPAFWNFKLNLLDIMGSDATAASIPKFPQGYGLHLFGAVWLYTLLVNRQQDASQVYTGAGETVEKIRVATEVSFEQYLDYDSAPVFSPENIFWNPEAVPLNDAWHTLWKRSLSLGFQLFEGSSRDPEQWSMDAFATDLETLRQHIWEHLFPLEPLAPETEHEVEDKAISGVLINILKQWRDRIEAPSDELEATVISMETDGIKEDESGLDMQAEVDMDTCIILSPDAEVPGISPVQDAKEDQDDTVILGGARETPGEEADAGSQEDVQIDETVILSPDVSAMDIKPAATQKNDLKKTDMLTAELQKTSDAANGLHHEDYDLEKTVILGGAPDPPVAKGDIISQENDQMDETVILSPDVSPPEAVPPKVLDDELDKTVIQTPQRRKTTNGTSSVRPDEEDMDETVILSTDAADKDTLAPVQEPVGENKTTETPDADLDESLDETIIIQPDKDRS